MTPDGDVTWRAGNEIGRPGHRRCRPTAGEGERVHRMLSALVGAGIEKGYLVNPMLAEVIRPARIPAERDKEVIRMSRCIVVVESGRGSLEKLVLKAKAEGRAVSYIKQMPRIGSTMTIASVQMDWLADEPN